MGNGYTAVSLDAVGRNGRVVEMFVDFWVFLENSNNVRGRCWVRTHCNTAAKEGINNQSDARFDDIFHYFPLSASWQILQIAP